MIVRPKKTGVDEAALANPGRYSPAAVTPDAVVRAPDLCDTLNAVAEPESQHAGSERNPQRSEDATERTLQDKGQTAVARTWRRSGPDPARRLCSC